MTRLLAGVALLAVVVGCGSSPRGPTGNVTTLAGAVASGNVNGPGTEARFHGPAGLAVAADGTAFVADAANDSIREITVDGTTSTLAGNARAGLVDGPGAAAEFNVPAGLALDGIGGLIVGDMLNNAIRRVDLATGTVATITGQAGPGDLVDGPLAAARFSRPAGVWVEAGGTVIDVCDSGNNVIRRIDLGTGTVSTLAGVRAGGHADGPGLSAAFVNPGGITGDGAGGIYVTDQSNTVRHVSAAGNVSTPLGVGGAPGYQEGPASYALFAAPIGLALAPDGTLYIADRDNGVVRAWQPGGDTWLVAGVPSSVSFHDYMPGPAASAILRAPSNLAVAPDGSILVSSVNVVCVIGGSE